MKQIELRRDWKFYEANEGTAYCQGKPAPVSVELPHDYIITKPRIPGVTGNEHNAYFPDGRGIYERMLDIPADWQDKHVWLEVDGAFMNAEVLLNDELILHHPNGYIPFQCDLTSALRYGSGENFLRIFTQSGKNMTRWYNGGGLYRNVRLLVGGPAWLDPWDLYVTTSGGKVTVEYCISGEVSMVSGVQVTVLDGQGDPVAQTIAAVASRVSLSVPEPQLWDLDRPYLYTCRVRLFAGSEMLDETETAFGFREISFDVEKGFQLNGKAMKLKGGCIHHDNGILGACAYPKADERKLKKLKAAGYNTVRFSHYPPSREFLDICDRIGMLVMDEAFDVWTRSKVPMDYHLYFEAWWERDLEAMVKRDRNHPCIITWSIGNEIKESNGSAREAQWSRRLADKVRSLDPTRPVLCALCGIFPVRQTGSNEMALGNLTANQQTAHPGWEEKTKDFLEPLDMIGCNYLKDIYQRVHEAHPTKPIIASETHPFTTYDYWEKVEQLPYVLGDCIWAAWDYLGEVGVGRIFWEEEGLAYQTSPYPWRTAWQADFDIIGNRRPQSIYREIMWGNEKLSGLYAQHPRHYGKEFFSLGWHWHDVEETWNFEEAFIAKPVLVQIYGAGDETELWLNGKSLGRVPMRELMAEMTVPYMPGTLETAVYRQGKEISRCSLKTAGQPSRLELQPEEPAVTADGLDLAFVGIALTDEAGTVCPAEEEITLSVIGGELLAVGSGAPASEDRFGENRCCLYRGRALAVIRTRQPGPIRIYAVTASGISGQCTVEGVVG